MHICITLARGRLGDLVQRVQHGEEVIFTRHGHAVARLSSLKPRLAVEASAKSIRQTAGGKPAKKQNHKGHPK